MSMKDLQKQVRVTPRDSRSLDLYLRDIARLPLLSVDEEVSLAKRIHAGDEQAVERLVLGNVRFVVTVAKHYMGCGLELPDLISAGNIGLIVAARRFDETRGNRFCSYAIWWIRQSILCALGRESHMVAIPANQLALLSRFSNETARLEQELQHTPSTSEVTDRLQQKEAHMNRLLRASLKMLSLNAPLSDEEDYALVDTLTDPAAPATDDALMRESLHDDLECLLANLSQNESKVLKMYFGSGHPRTYSMDEIGLRMNLSRERVRQLHTKAMSRLQRSSSKEHLRDYL